MTWQRESLSALYSKRNFWKGSLFMKISAMLGQRFKETPAECKIDSHIFMIRGGYMKRVGEGIYSLLPPGLRIVKKIEKIMRHCGE